jgi:hypothetical protein
LARIVKEVAPVSPAGSSGDVKLMNGSGIRIPAKTVTLPIADLK